MRRRSCASRATPTSASCCSRSCPTRSGRCRASRTARKRRKRTKQVGSKADSKSANNLSNNVSTINKDSCRCHHWHEPIRRALVLYLEWHDAVRQPHSNDPHILGETASLEAG